MAYDPLGNATTTMSLAANQSTGPSTLGTYNGLTSTFRDERGFETRRTSNPAARTLTVREPNLFETVYANNRLGRLTGVTDALGNVTTMTYDLLGRKLTMNDPDMGAWSYTYDAAGNLKTQTDARSVTTTLVYDALSRLTSKAYGGGSPPVTDSPVTFRYDTYTFDDFEDCASAPGYAVSQPGRLISTTHGATKQLSCLDIRGRGVMGRTTVDGVGYNVSRTFDALDQVIDLTYPDGELVHYSSYAQGQINGLSSTTHGQTLLSGATHTPWHAVSSLTLGTGQITNYTYDYRLRLNTLKTGTSTTPGSSQDLTLTYDDASNVAAVTDSTGTPETVTYSYDSLNRLTGGTGFAGALTANYTYNAIGNMLMKQEGASNLTLSYPASGPSSVRPHAVTSTTGTQGLSLSYDANGNLTTQGASAYGYDAENRLKTRSASGGTVSYTYDGNGTMVKRTNADGTWTVYIGGVYEKSFTAGGAVTGSRKYYGALGRTIAVRDVPAGGGAGTLSYLLADHLGSTVEALDTAGNTIAGSEIKYWPYGGTRTGGVPQTDKLYTRQQQEPGDAALGLYNYKARFYSTTLGRFVSADNRPAEKGSNGLNRYSYVVGNPLSFVDPSGNVPEIPSEHDSAVSNCGRDPMNCMMWSAQGNWNTYLGLVAHHFSIDVGILSGILLNEIKHRSGRPWPLVEAGQRLGAGLLDLAGINVRSITVRGAGTFDVNDPSIGIAQMKASAALFLESIAKLVPAQNSANRTEEILLTHSGSVFYAAAFLSWIQHEFLPSQATPYSKNSDALIATYNLGPEEYANAGEVHDGCGYCGPMAQEYIANTRAYLPSARDALAAKLDDGVRGRRY
jgi:RHS repeat-associated protein